MVNIESSALIDMFLFFRSLVPGSRCKLSGLANQPIGLTSSTEVGNPSNYKPFVEAIQEKLETERLLMHFFIMRK